MNYPAGYEWLSGVGILPKMVTEALKEYGTIELPGTRNSAKIINWSKEVKLSNVYTADAIPWCGLFMKVVADRAGKPSPKEPLWALNWAKIGTPAGQPALGDILIFTRTGGAHVTLYIAEDSGTYHCLGGNQNDSVCITRIDKKRLFSARRPKMFFQKPESVQPYIVTNIGGLISKDEA